MNSEVFSQIKELIDRVLETSPFYKKVFKDAGLTAADIKTPEDFEKIPFTDKEALREAYPMGLLSVPQEQVVRIHSTSGTTGTPVIIPYTKQDVEDWATMFARCFEIAGVTNKDVIQITPGYGLWTAGIGFQAGCEKLGAMAIPMGPGNTDKQFQMMIDLKSTVLCSTSSYALLIAEEAQRRGIKDKLSLKRGIIGSELWGDLMRKRIERELNIELFDIYGLTEVYGPGIAIDCDKHEGLHYFDDFLYFEVIDSNGNPVKDGEWGELVVTTLKKQAAPLIRYRTHDLTRKLTKKCSCGREYPMIDRIMGRTDDMVKVKGVNIYPGQINTVLTDCKGVSSEYQVHITHENGRDIFKLKVERKDGFAPEEVEKEVAEVFKRKIGIKIEVEAVAIGDLPRSEKKSKRVFDYRQK
ncbi:MAG: phenylacetate--CoA ligase [[Clostridium] cellulosi]